MSIRPDAAEALGKVAEVIRSHATAPIEIEGHTDGKGQPAYNQKLSEQRAESVKAWLARNGGIDGRRARRRPRAAREQNGQDRDPHRDIRREARP